MYKTIINQVWQKFASLHSVSLFILKQNRKWLRDPATFPVWKGRRNSFWTETGETNKTIKLSKTVAVSYFWDIRERESVKEENFDCKPKCKVPKRAPRSHPPHQLDFLSSMHLINHAGCHQILDSEKIKGGWRCNRRTKLQCPKKNKKEK